MKHITAVLIIGFISSCGPAIDNPSTITRPTTLVPADGFDDDPIGIVKSLNLGFLDPVPRVTAYIESMKRVSMLNTNSLDEEWSRDLSQEYSRAFHIPSLDGVFLINSNEVRLVTQDEEKTVRVDSGSSFIQDRYARAVQKTRYVVGGSDGSLFTSIVRKDDGTFVVGSLDNVAQFGEAQENWSSIYNQVDSFPSIAPLLSDDGAVLIFIESQWGTYSYYQLDEEGTYGEGVKSCLPSSSLGGDAISETPDSTEENAFKSLTAALLNGAGDRLIYGSQDGKLGYVDLSPDGACARIDLSHTNALDLGGKIERIIEGESGTFYVTVGELLKVVKFDGSSLQLESEYTTGCQIPVASAVIGGQYIFSSCLFSILSNQDVYDVLLTTKSIDSNEALRELVIQQESTARISIDAESMKLYLVKDNGFGKVLEYNLLNEESRQGPSFVLDGVLERL